MANKLVLGSIALAIIALLGVSLISANGFGMGFMNQNLTDEEKADMKVNRDAIRTAIEEGDFATWKALMEEQIAKMQDSLTEENFQAIQEKHNEMKQNGFPENNKKGMGKGMHQGNCPMAE